MRSERTLDYGLAISVIDRVFDEISEDGIDLYVPDVVNEHWIALYKDQLIGMYRIHQVNAITYQIHAFILPEFRCHSKESGEVILKWCLDNLDFNKLIAEIPAKYENVLNFTRHQGFKDEGINRESFLKDGKIWDTYRLGITRKEIEYGHSNSDSRRGGNRIEGEQESIKSGG